MSNELNLNPADVDNMTRAVRLAQDRGAFQMEETVALLPSVTRLEDWIKTIKQAQEQAQEQELEQPTPPSEEK